MNDLLKKLWTGELHLDYTDTNDPEYVALLKKEQALYEALVQSIGFDKIDPYATAQSALCSHLCQQRFLRGLCLGGQFILSMLSEDYNPPVTS